MNTILDTLNIEYKQSYCVPDYLQKWYHLYTDAYDVLSVGMRNANEYDSIIQDMIEHHGKLKEMKVL